MKSFEFRPPSEQQCSRRQLLVRASQGGLAVGALSAAANGAAAEAAEQPANRTTAAAAVRVTDFERSCLRFRIDTTKKPPKTVFSQAADDVEQCPHDA